MKQRLAQLAIVAGFLAGSVALLFIDEVKAANFSMQTGYYFGTGASLAITGVGFNPDYITIKSPTTAGAAVFKTTAMAAANTAFTSATADNATTQITFNSDGFTVGTLANVNTTNTIYYWTAFDGSDCTSTGNFCVGTYTGNATNPRTITVGFQPSFVQIKRSTAVDGHFRTASMAANTTHFLTSTAGDTAGNYIQSFGATSFVVGVTDNVSAGVYYYVAFRTTTSAFAEGTYAGNATDNRNITAPNFQPQWAIVKNATSATVNNRRPMMLQRESYGDNAAHIGTNVANTVNELQSLISTGFQVGSAAMTNENAATFYWIAFGGAPLQDDDASTFTMKTGSYTGNGTSQSITGLGFAPDLVIIKDNAANYGVFRTRLGGDNTWYLSNAATFFTGGITATGSDGFTLGASLVVNASAATYHWQAFGNAFDPYDNNGAGDFAIGTYYGNGIDNRDIEVPWQPNMVATKRSGASVGNWRSSSVGTDTAFNFGPTANASNLIQNFSSTGFQVGTSATSNGAANNYMWFAFKTGTNFAVNTYTGTGANANITTAGFQPNNLWVKQSTAVEGVQRPSTLAGDNTQYFANLANVAGRITAFISNGFSVGTGAEVNTSAGTYYYVAWRVPVTGELAVGVVNSSGTPVASPSVTLPATNFLYSCTNNTTNTLGENTQRIRITNTTGSPMWSLTIAATAGNTGLWRNGGDTQQYDFNDSGGSPAGCTDGADADTKAGQMTINPSTGTIGTANCAATGITLGSSAAYVQGTTDTLTLSTAGGTAGSNCFWDLTGMTVGQYIPLGQPSGTYTIDQTITIVAT